jgi:hypothetical protein
MCTKRIRRFFAVSFLGCGCNSIGWIDHLVWEIQIPAGSKRKQVPVLRTCTCESTHHFSFAFVLRPYYRVARSATSDHPKLVKKRRSPSSQLRTGRTDRSGPFFSQSSSDAESESLSTVTLSLHFSLYYFDIQLLLYDHHQRYYEV